MQIIKNVSNHGIFPHRRGLIPSDYKDRMGLKVREASFLVALPCFSE